MPQGLEGVLTAVVVAPSVQRAGDRATVTSLVPVPGREAANAMLVKRAGDARLGNLGLRQNGSTCFTLGRNQDTFILADAGQVNRIRVAQADNMTLNGSVEGLVDQDEDFFALCNEDQSTIPWRAVQPGGAVHDPRGS